MPNVFKYAPGATAPGTLKKGDFLIGNNTADYGGTYYTGITPVTGGYTIYQNKPTGGPAINYAINDAEMIQYTFLISNQSFGTGPSALNWYNTQSDKVVVNMDYPTIITSGLVLALDPGYTPSFPKGGSSWYDVSGYSPAGSIFNNPTFSTELGGALTFDGSDDYASVGGTGPLNSLTSSYSLTVLAQFPNATRNYNTIFARRNPSTALSDIEVYTGNGGITVLHNRSNGGNLSYNIFTSVPNNRISVITLTYGSNVWNMYFNGVLSQTMNTDVGGGPISNPLATPGNVTEIGKFFYGYAQETIWNYYIYNKTLSSSEVTLNYQALLPRILQENIVTSGLVAYYDAGYVNSYPGSGTSWFNVSGVSGGSGTLWNGPVFNPATGGFFSFDGTDDYVGLGTFLNQFQRVNLPYSMESFAYINTSSNNEFIIGNTWDDAGFHIRKRGSSHPPSDGIRFLMIQNGDNGCGKDSAALTTGWYHIVGTYNGNGASPSNFSLYINASTSGTTNVSFGTVTSISPTNETNIARSGDPTLLGYFRGNISIVRVYNRALSSQEVLQNFNAQRSRYGI